MEEKTDDVLHEEQQEGSRLNISREIHQESERKSEEASCVSPTASLPPLLGLGHGAPLLKPTPRRRRVPRRRVNGNDVSQQAEGPPTTTTPETSEKLQLIRVKFLRLSHRLGQTPRNSVVVAWFLYSLGLPELSSSHDAGAFISSINRAISMAEQLEAAGGGQDLDFACTIMLLGKSGVGKSATINSIFNDDQVCTTDAFQMGTKSVGVVEGFVQGIKVLVIDTPGLSPSPFDQSKNKKTLKSIRAFIKKTPPDVVLYLDRLDYTQSIDADMLLLRTITHVLGPSIWSNAILGLTHASSAPPDGAAASSYDMFVTRRCHAIQLDIRLAAGDDVRLPVSLVENHPACRTNRATGQRVLPNGQAWMPHLLLLSFASKILAEENALLQTLQNNNNNNNNNNNSRARSKAPPPLPPFLSSLLESDQLPPFKQFKKLTEADISRLFSKSDEKEQYFIDTSNPSLIVKPVLASKLWDHDISGYDGVSAEGRLVVKEKIQMSYSGCVAVNVMKMKGANVQLEMASLVEHGNSNRSTSLGFEMQKYPWRELYCTLRSDTNFRKQKAAAGLAVTLLGDSVSAGVKGGRKLIANKRLGIDVYGGGTMTSLGDAAYWGSLEARLLGRFLSTLRLSVVDGHRGRLVFGGNIQTQVPLGRSSDITARANMNSRGAVKVSIRANIFEHLEHAMAALVPLFKKLHSYYYSP
ncbi:unnamed protein product [Eruca vesicaria subsp. sativa]|uniref:AIG1-type G domain-containing protein n=1 Tax=Eruca vesicaria subsp. sativa TaxID=29727 RepID=A0ABC8KQJ3_ERUVS|nr:unnamed protein product [Eruca vesicaria subsp. sativa]